MADSEVAALTEDTTPDPSDWVYLVDSAGTVDKKVSVSNLIEPSRSKVVAESHSPTTVANDSTEQTVATLTLPGGTVAVGDRVIMRLWGSIKNSSGSAVTYSVTGKVGAASLPPNVGVSIATDASNRRLFTAVIECVFPTLTSQNWLFQYTMANALPAGVTGAMTTFALSGGKQTGTDNTASDLVFAVTNTMGTASANAEIVVDIASLEIIKK